jgi:hypothetical protein
MNIIETTQALIDNPYAEKSDLSWWASISTHGNNFFRNNARRKIVLLNDATGDYEQDEEMTQEKEFEMEAENDAVYKNAQAVLFDY